MWLFSHYLHCSWNSNYRSVTTEWYLGPHGMHLSTVWPTTHWQSPSLADVHHAALKNDTPHSHFIDGQFVSNENTKTRGWHTLIQWAEGMWTLLHPSVTSVNGHQTEVTYLWVIYNSSMTDLPVHQAVDEYIGKASKCSAYSQECSSSLSASCSLPRGYQASRLFLYTPVERTKWNNVINSHQQTD